MIYAIQAKGTPYIKIGFTTTWDGRTRLEQLQTGCPFELELLALGLGTRAWEGRIHLDLKVAKRHHFREWFVDSMEVRRWIAWINSQQRGTMPIPALGTNTVRLGRVTEYAKGYSRTIDPIDPERAAAIQKRKEERARPIAIARTRDKRPRCLAAPDLGDWWQKRVAARLYDKKAPHNEPVIQPPVVDKPVSA